MHSFTLLAVAVGAAVVMASPVAIDTTNEILTTRQGLGQYLIYDKYIYNICDLTQDDPGCGGETPSCMAKGEIPLPVTTDMCFGLCPPPDQDPDGPLPVNPVSCDASFGCCANW